MKLIKYVIMKKQLSLKLDVVGSCYDSISTTQNFIAFKS